MENNVNQVSSLFAFTHLQPLWEVVHYSYKHFWYSCVVFLTNSNVQFLYREGFVCIYSRLKAIPQKSCMQTNLVSVEAKTHHLNVTSHLEKIFVEHIALILYSCRDKCWSYYNLLTVVRCRKCNRKRRWLSFYNRSSNSKRLNPMDNRVAIRHFPVTLIIKLITEKTSHSYYRVSKKHQRSTEPWLLIFDSNVKVVRYSSLFGKILAIQKIWVSINKSFIYEYGFPLLDLVRQLNYLEFSRNIVIPLRQLNKKSQDAYTSEMVHIVLFVVCLGKSDILAKQILTWK